ncbi:unnamed protein product [Paramecium primaurelia]|uniref:Fungal lipase-type domain-containing protein n=1 Tax=Paramecium primaurelia TaxID=5886 RepID=A0A8S1L8V9_PARPR|nr:unnamed protein product [Paramecium primaurelia]
MKHLLIVLLLICVSYANKGFIEKEIEKVFKHKSNVNQIYSHSLAQQFFHYTKIAVCHPKEIADWDCGYYCQQHPDMIDVQAFAGNYSSQAYCGYNQKENYIVLVYRSTQDLTNWINNVKFFKQEFGDCKDCAVHLGFWETYTAISNEMINCTKTLRQKYPKSKVLITGHSLGGAIAALMAVDVTRLGIQVDNFFTYGAPRVGNIEFATWFINYVVPKEYWRVTHYADTVVHTPPMNFYYSHLPQEVWYNEENTSFKICLQGLVEDDTCSNSLWWYSISDHTSYFNEFQECKTQFIHHNETMHFIGKQSDQLNNQPNLIQDQKQ